MLPARLVEEHALFPNARNDDQVDALAQALSHTASYRGTLRPVVPSGMLRLPTSTDYGILSTLSDRWR